MFLSLGGECGGEGVKLASQQCFTVWHLVSSASGVGAEDEKKTTFTWEPLNRVRNNAGQRQNPSEQQPL